MLLKALAGSCRAIILSIAETKNGKKDEGQKIQANCKAGILAKAQRQEIERPDIQYNVPYRHKKYDKKPPPWLANNFQQYDDVVKRNDTSPSWFVSFLIRM